MEPEDDTLRTSWTRVARLKNVSDEESWREFHQLYGGLIMCVALRAGLREGEAEEVVQETMVSLARHIGEFEANPARGSFRPWLLQMARWRIQDQFRKRLPLADDGQAPSDTTSGTPPVERVPDTREVDLAGRCDADWEKGIMELALKELQRSVKAAHYQVFYLLTVKQRPAADVARTVGCPRAQVYLIRHRLAKALKPIVERLRRKLG